MTSEEGNSGANIRRSKIIEHSKKMKVITLIDRMIIDMSVLIDNLHRRRDSHGVIKTISKSSNAEPIISAESIE